MADTTTGKAYQSPSINNARQAVFWSNDDSSVHRIDRWDQNSGTLTNLVTATRSTNATNPEFLDARVGFNDLGRVSFLRTQSNVGGVLKSLESAGDLGGQVHWTTSSASSFNVSGLSNSGRIVYTETTSSSPATTNVWTIDINGSKQSFGRGSLAPAINASNEIAFIQQDRLQLGSSPSNIQSISLPSSMLPQNSVAVNDSGKMAFIAVDYNSAISGYNLYSGQIGSGLTMVASANQFTDLSSTTPSINNLGDLLFTGSLGGTRGIFSTATGLSSPIIKVGDALDGSIVTSLSVSTDSINDFRDIAFVAMIQDGRTGVYYGTFSAVPEPSSLLLVLLGGAAYGWNRRKRKSNLDEEHFDAQLEKCNFLIGEKSRRIRREELFVRRYPPTSATSRRVYAFRLTVKLDR
ncbi:DUF7453 family protein [Pirellulaceae bacterium SH501]